MRTKKVLMNYLTEVIPQMLILLIGFFKTKVFLTYLGDEMVSLFQLFSQFLYYLSLADGGATSAIGYYLYKPLKENDDKSIGSILSATIRFFTVVAAVVFVLGLILDVNIMFFIKNATISTTIIRFMFFLILISNVLSYFYTPYTLFMDANQERYIYNIWLQPVMIVRSIVEIILVMKFKSLYVVLILQLIVNVYQNIMVRVIYNKRYKKYNLKSKPDFGFTKKIKDIIPHRIASLISNNIDIILVSKMINIKEVVVYTAYYSITETLQKFVDYFASAMIPGVGNVLVTTNEEKGKAYNVFLEYNELLFFIATVICVPLFFSISTFIKIWYGKKLVVNEITMFFFVILLFYRIIRNALGTFIASKALYKETIICSYLEAVINLLLSIVLVKKIGLLGLLIGTFASLVISEFLIKPGILKNKVFEVSKMTYYKDVFKYMVVYFILLVLFYFVYPHFNINSLLIWFINSTIIFIINVVLVLLIYKFIFKAKFINRLKEMIFKKVKHV